MDSNGLIETIGKMADVIIENKQYLTQLDTEIGDGDHGINMARGFSMVKDKLSELTELSCSEILITVGKTILREVGGSSGPFYGMLFQQAGRAVKDQEEIFASDLGQMLSAGLEKVQFYGHAAEGEKTMVDAICPAIRALAAGEGLAAAAEAAEEAAEHTKDYIATKGRASYLGERSLGHRDPGASSFALLMKSIAS